MNLTEAIAYFKKTPKGELNIASNQKLVTLKVVDRDRGDGDQMVFTVTQLSDNDVDNDDVMEIPQKRFEAVMANQVFGVGKPKSPAAPEK